MRARIAAFNVAQRSAVLVGVLTVLAALVYVALPFEDRGGRRCTPAITGSERPESAVATKAWEKTKSEKLGISPPCQTAGRDRLYRAGIMTGAVIVGSFAAVQLLTTRGIDTG